LSNLYRFFKEHFKEINSLKNPGLKVFGDTVIGSLKNYLMKWFFKEPWIERFFVESVLVPRRTLV